MCMSMGEEELEELVKKIKAKVLKGTIEFSSDISRNHFPHFKIL